MPVVVVRKEHPNSLFEVNSGSEIFTFWTGNVHVGVVQRPCRQQKSLVPSVSNIVACNDDLPAFPNCLPLLSSFFVPGKRQLLYPFPFLGLPTLYPSLRYLLARRQRASPIASVITSDVGIAGGIVGGY